MAVFNTLRKKGEEVVDALKQQMDDYEMEYQMAQDKGSPLPGLFGSKEEYDMSRRIGLTNPVSMLLAKAGPAPTAKLYQEQIRPAVTQAFSQTPAFTPMGKVQKGIIGMGGQFFENMARGIIGGSPERYQQDVQLSQNLQAGTPTQTDLEELKRIDTEFMTEFGTMAGTLTPRNLGEVIRIKPSETKALQQQMKYISAATRGGNYDGAIKLTKALPKTYEKKMVEVINEANPNYVKKATNYIKGADGKFGGSKSISSLADDVTEGVGKFNIRNTKTNQNYRDSEEFLANEFDNLLEDLRGVKRDSVVTIPTEKVEVVWKDDYKNALETAKDYYDPKNAPPVEFEYDIKTGKYILQDGHNRFISARNNGQPIKGKVEQIKGNMDELADLYKKEKGVSIEDLFNKLKPTTEGVGKTDLLSEANKAIAEGKSADEFIKGQQPTKIEFESATKKADYMGGHEAPMADESNAPIWDLTGKYNGDGLYPDDIYSADATRLYSSGFEYDNSAMATLRSVKNRPNAPVEVYRAVPKDVKGEINPGDWVTLTKEYAKEHGDSNIGGAYKIIKKRVYARDIFTDANSIQEFGYDPQPRLSPDKVPFELLSNSMEKTKQGKRTVYSSYIDNLTDIYNQAKKLKKGK